MRPLAFLLCSQFQGVEKRAPNSSSNLKYYFTVLAS